MYLLLSFSVVYMYSAWIGIFLTALIFVAGS